MSKVYYPAVFHIAQEGGYWIEFPDLDGCFSEGNSDVEAFKMAQEALGLYLDDNLNVPKPRTCAEIQKLYPNELVMLVDCDPIRFSRQIHSRISKENINHS